MNEHYIGIENLKIPIKKIAPNCNIDENLQPFIASHCKLDIDDINEYQILSKSIDARQKPNIFLIYTLNVSLHKSPVGKTNIKPAKTMLTTSELPEKNLTLSSNKTAASPLIVGTGPAGLMAALLMAEYGLKPTIIDRGFNVEKRKNDIDNFFNTRELNCESNLLFGEGGAGTYSDGKLFTRVKSPHINYILQSFVAAGAPEEILYLKRPHIGSDKLPNMITNIRKKIESMGGTFLWGHNVTDIIVSDGRCQGVITEAGKTIEASVTMIAPGHSARELIKTLLKRGVDHKLKDFQIGCRIEHTQAFIDNMQYATMNPSPLLGAAEYNLVSRPPKKFKSPAVTTFCMCPGGEIIPATSDKGMLSINGMSLYARNGKFANAGLIVNQSADNFNSAEEAFNLLEQLERESFNAGGGNYSSPAQGAYAFTREEKSLPSEESSYRLGIVSARLDMMLPKKTTQAIVQALIHFEKLAPGFMHSAKLLGLETRASSPVRFIRDATTMESSLQNLYIAGEGAGYAGGIISAAIDGVKIATRIISD